MGVAAGGDVGVLCGCVVAVGGAAVGGTVAVGKTVGGSAVGVGASSVAEAAGSGVTADTGASVGGGGGLAAEDSAELAAPTADASAPTADQARLPSSKMPTMPTMVAISRAGEPSSDGGPGRPTLRR